MLGYWAQIWRSVLAWLELGDDQRLFLEGAEDFDLVDAGAAETVQVKDLASRITLRSKEVADAISHLFEHRRRNQGQVIRFRFLATGGSGVEQGASFGGKDGGLNLWRQARASGDMVLRQKIARQIADFLVTDGKISNTVKDFISNASDATLWLDLILAIDWDFDAAGTTEIIQEVKNKLVVLGHEKSVSADRAEAVAEYLYTYAYETATRQKDRTLTRAELLRLFDSKTRQSLPAAAYDSILGAFGALYESRGSAMTAIGTTTATIGRPPPLPPRYFARTQVLAEVERRIFHQTTLVLEGGTGVGKSTVAASHLASSGDNWGWVDLRGVDSAAIAVMLHRAAVAVSAETGIFGVVLDDIAVPADPRPIEASLMLVKSAIETRGGKLIVTSAAPWPQRLRLVMDLDADGSFSIPAFSRQEIVSYLAERGCPPERAAVWAAYIELHTQGHAQLVHARVVALEGQGFPAANLADLSATPPDVIEARTEARGLVSMLQPATRALIYRLSLMVSAFTRAQAIAVAMIPPAIHEPGLILDGLLGPWLEVIIDGLYRVSPLLQSLGTDVNGPDWALAAHQDIGRTLASFRTISPTDVSSILFHATHSRDWPTITHLAFALLRADADTWVALADSISWFTLVGSGDAGTYIDAEPFSRFVVRLLQFRINAVRGETDQAIRIFDIFDIELPSDTVGDPLLMARYVFLASLLLRTEIRLPVQRFVDVGLEYIALSDRFAAQFATAKSPEFDRLMAGPDGGPD